MTHPTDTNVHLDYIESLKRWLIVEDETGNIVKGYASEANAMFDYAALRNGEDTIEDVKHCRIQIGDRVACRGLERLKGTVVKRENGVITAKMDYHACESTTQFSAASSWIKIDE